MTNRRGTTTAVDDAPPAIRMTWPIVAAFTILIPLWVSPGGYEQFRLAKLALFRAEGILVGALLLLAAVHHPADARSRWKVTSAPLLLPLLILAWTIVATCASEERQVSAASMMTVAAGVAIFFASYDYGRHGSEKAVWGLYIAVLLNAIVIFIEMRKAWSLGFARALIGDVSITSLVRVAPIAFMGNRDYLGDLVVPAAILALAMAVMPGASWLIRITTAILILALIATKTLTSMVAFAIAALVLSCLRSRKAALAAAIVIVVALPIAFYAHPGLRLRARKAWTHLQSGRVDDVLAGRIPPNLAALAMITDHPLTGVGPGLFGKNYSPYRAEAARRYARVVSTGKFWIDEYFLDAHDDHLQIASEAGVVAYLLFLATVTTGALLSFRVSPDATASTKRQLARTAAAPLFVGLFVLALAHFPLQLAGTLQAFIVSAGLVAGWSDDVSA